jgi:hypothetical protein
MVPVGASPACIGFPPERPDPPDRPIA